MKIIILGLPVCLLKSLQGQDEQLCVMFVGERRERDGREPPTFQPVNSGGVDGYRFFSCDVGAILLAEQRDGCNSVLLCESQQIKM